MSATTIERTSGAFNFHKGDGDSRQVIITDGGVGDVVFDKRLEQLIYQKVISGANDLSDAEKVKISQAAIYFPSILENTAAGFARAGADVTITGTFGINFYQTNLTEDVAKRWMQSAFDIARRVRQDHGANIIAGSIRPTGDTYIPEDTPDDVELKHNHERIIQLYSDIRFFEDPNALLWPETMPTVREPGIAAGIINDYGAPFITSVVANENESGTVADGSTAEKLVDTVLEPYRGTAMGIAVNCGSFDEILPLVREIRRVYDERGIQDKEIIALPNAHRRSRKENHAGAEFGDHGHTDCSSAGGCSHEANSRFSPQEFAEKSVELIRAGATGVGGCCGSEKEHIAELDKMAQTVSLAV